MNKLLKKKTPNCNSFSCMAVNALVVFVVIQKNGYPYLRQHRNRALLIMNSLLKNCSSTKSWLCLPHSAVHSNRLALQEAAAGELPLHSALLWLSLPFVVLQKFKLSHPQQLMSWHTAGKRESALTQTCFAGTLKCQWKYFGWLERCQFYFLYCQEYESLA